MQRAQSPSLKRPSWRSARLLVEKFGIAICPAYIGHRQPLTTSIMQGKGATEAFPKDKASDEIKALWDALNKLSPILAPIQTPAKTKKKRAKAK